MTKNIYLNDIGDVIFTAGEFLEKKAKRIENGETKVPSSCLMGLLWDFGELDPLYLLLEVPVINKSLLPFWYELSF